MKLQVPFIQLPLRFDAGALAAEIQALEENCWKPHPQGFAGNSMLPLIAVDGDPDNESFAGAMRPTPHLARCPYLAQAMGSIGATLGRSRLMRLSGHAEVAKHADQGYYWIERVRVHVPIITQPTVRFFCGDAEVNMAAGECWIFDTWRLHRVLNDNDHARVHLVIDTVGGDRFWELAARGRALGAPQQAGWTPHPVAPMPGMKPELRFESVNVPTVMSPWEINTHLAFLFAESVPHPQLPALQTLAARFSRHWQGLWACYGDRAEGRAQFRAVLDAFLREFRAHGQQVVLRNNIQLFSAVMTIIGKVAVAADHAPLRAAPIDPRAIGDRA